EKLRIHHGAVDQTMITTRPPGEVMNHVRDVLNGMGMEIMLESEFKYRCVRQKRRKGVVGTGQGTMSSSTPTTVVIQETIYGDVSQDAGDEVRFSVELTRIDRLNDTFSLDIRRLKGNLRSYKFLYDTIR
ncbi:hypothetical protein AGABI2DRAFT_60111, partial [Agaricus bisporus var. bisporus H97]|uniref:hypothetical protein n=1 Tax=Agaricus bisporus var. bisporus (strain H97 / ATCC MYA-4626 / FGSC 10389) TaxID=936046 RepID=UPI00029F5600